MLTATDCCLIGSTSYDKHHLGLPPVHCLDSFLAGQLPEYDCLSSSVHTCSPIDRASGTFSCGSVWCHEEDLDTSQTNTSKPLHRSLLCSIQLSLRSNTAADIHNFAGCWQLNSISCEPGNCKARDRRPQGSCNLVCAGQRGGAG